MSEETVRKLLKDVGLTEKETEVYIFLAKHGALKGIEIAKRIEKHKAQVYNILKNLQTKGLVESTLEFPTRFTVVPFETVIDLNIKAKRDEAAFIENTKKEILSYWKNVNPAGLEPSLEKFVVIEGNNKIYAKISQMITETKTQFSAVSTVPGLLSAYRFGIFDAALHHPLKTSVSFRFLIELSEQDVSAMKTILNMKPRAEFEFKGRTPDLGAKLPLRMVIRDGEELILFVTQKTESSEKQNEISFWTNCKTLVQSFTNVFREMWRNASDLEKKIVEIEAGEVSPRTFDIADAETALATYEKILNSAKDEVIMIKSATGIVASANETSQLKNIVEKGVLVKIMAPITRENLKASQQLSEFCEIKHVPADYAEMTLVDGQHLFQFKKPHTNQAEVEGLTNFKNTVYSNDYEYLKKTKILLDDLWKNARPPSRFALQSFVNPLMQSTVPPVKTRYGEYGKLMRPSEGKLGALTEKEVLNKIINAQKTPAKTWKDTITFYGSTAVAVVHPPEHFNLPDMILSIYHNNKQSSFGAEDFMVIHLWLETPRGHAYVPVAMVIDNPKGLTLRKAVWAGTPVADNFQVVKKNELEVRVQGNTLFAGWTVPIKLVPSKYILPPSCILFEGYGKLVSGISQTSVPSGRKVTTEYNGFEAFVTFFHPASKYSGLGTDGLFARDAIVTSVANST